LEYETAKVEYVVVLLTPDDIGSAKDEANNLKSRARQNVILELGYFVGKLGRGRVCPLYKSDVELPYVPEWMKQLRSQV
jgi:predicted nucleotide-binding protein